MARKRRIGFLTRLRIKKGLRAYHLKKASGRILRKPSLTNKEL